MYQVPAHVGRGLLRPGVAWYSVSMTTCYFNRWMLALAAGLLAGCQGDITVDLTTTSGTSADVRQLVTGVLGLEFVKDDGSTETLEFKDSEPVNLIEFQDGDLLTLFTKEELPVGVYTGVRLLFDDDEDTDYLIDGAGAELKVIPTVGEYAAMDYTVEEDKTSNEALTLTLDIRQSLSFDEDANEYTLKPVLRSVRSDEASVIQGSVAVSCPLGTTLLEGGAVYLFQGEGVIPDDRDGGAPDPYATTALMFSALTGEFTYRLLDLPEGDYTISATCNGDQENPVLDDVFSFRGTRNVQLDKEDVLTVNITN